MLLLIDLSRGTFALMPTFAAAIEEATLGHFNVDRILTFCSIFLMCPRRVAMRRNRQQFQAWPKMGFLVSIGDLRADSPIEKTRTWD